MVMIIDKENLTKTPDINTSETEMRELARLNFQNNEQIASIF